MAQLSQSMLFMGIVGALLGVLLGAGEHFCISGLRRVAPVPLAVVGWLAIAFVVVMLLNLIVGFARGKDPTGISLVFVFVGILLLAVVAGLAALQGRRDGIALPLACGHLMALLSSALLICYGLAQVLPNIAAWLHGGTTTDDGMVHWFPPVHVAGDWLYGTFLVSLVLLEIFRPFRHLLTKGG